MATTLDQKLADFLNNFNVNGWPVGNFILVIISLILTIFLCGLIGYEREKRGRSAGLRTHLLVGVGSCMIMIISIYGFPAAFSEKRDVARLVAQVITGVGFLGAGAIIHNNSEIRGLTTAGTIWIVMAIGIACGSFNFILATAATLLVLLILIFIRNFEVKIGSKRSSIHFLAKADSNAVEKVLLISKEFNCTVQRLNTEILDEGSETYIDCNFEVIFDSENFDITGFVSTLENKIGTKKIELFGSRQLKK